MFAAAAAVAGGTAGVVLAEHEAEIRLVAAATLAAIALHGLATLQADQPSRRPRAPSSPARAAGSHYARFFAITSVNPLTIASFAAVATSLPLGHPSAGDRVRGGRRRGLGRLAPRCSRRRPATRAAGSRRAYSAGSPSAAAWPCS